jgi:dTDP-4-amino-4,6-dideoxygalactose transaminase
MPPFEEYCEEIRELWETRWLTNMGTKHTQLEEHLKKYLNFPNLTLFANGHLALESIFEAMDLTGEVITTPFTFASTTNAIIRKNLTPIFCDINDSNYTIDDTKLESLITERTSAIVPVHVYGNICNTDNIDRIAQKYNLKIIYDAAHAFGETVNGSSVACFGDASMFSFHATKVFSTIEGGMATYRDAKTAEKLNKIKNFGIEGQEDVVCIGGNAKMNEFQAAMGLCNLRHFEEEIVKRKAVAECYDANLSNINGIKLSQVKYGVVSNYSYYTVVLDGYKYNRNELAEKLASKNIYARKYFYPPTNTFRAYHGMFEIQSTPIAQYISERVLTLPIYADLPLCEVKRICSIILS